MKETKKAVGGNWRNRMIVTSSNQPGLHSDLEKTSLCYTIQDLMQNKNRASKITQQVKSSHCTDQAT